jgi:hypothetical protein
MKIPSERRLPEAAERRGQVMTRRYLRVREAPEKYGGTGAAWRRWILGGRLGDAVVRLGRIVMLDSAKLDDRLERTGQLLLDRNKK